MYIIQILINRLLNTIKLIFLLTILSACSKSISLLNYRNTTESYTPNYSLQENVPPSIDSAINPITSENNLLATTTTLPTEIFIKAHQTSLISKTIPTKSVARTIQKPGHDQPKGNPHKNVFAYLGFLFSVLSLIFLFTFAELTVITLPIAAVFSILGLKSRKKLLSQIALVLTICLSAIVMYFVILLNKPY